jgi:excisionase family DNA binding protein
MKPSIAPAYSPIQTNRRTSATGEHPLLLTVDEAAALLRTTRRAMYAMVERQQIPGVIRIRRRVLFRAADLLDWLDQKCAPSPKE